MTSPRTEGAVRTPRKRRRSARSCQECRRRKVKCDRKEPCSHCVLTTTSCVFFHGPMQSAAPDGASRVSQFLAAPYTTPLQVDATQHSEKRPSPVRVNRRGDDNNGKAVPLAYLSDTALDDLQEFNELDQRAQSFEQPLSRRTASRAIETPHVSPLPSTPSFKNASLLAHNRSLALNKSRLFGKTHWSNSAHEFKNIATFLSSETGNSTDDERLKCMKAEIRASLQKCKLLAKSMKTNRPGRCFSCPAPIFTATEKGLADQMAQLYISRFESSFRILHIPSFWAEYEQYWRNPAEVSNAIQFKVHLIMAIGYSLHDDFSETTATHSAAIQWVYAAQNWLAGPLEKDRLSIGGLQVQCLLILARQILAVSGDMTWVAMGTIVHTAMQMGLHRDPKHFVKMSLLHGELRRRLWATILELSVQASLDAGMPPNLSLEDFDTDSPSNINDRDVDESTRTLEQCPDTTITDTSLQRFLFGCLRPRLEILRRMNGVCSETSYEEVLALSSVISNACRECSSRVKTDNETEGATFKQNLADLLVRRFLLSLHRPFASRARTNPMFYFSRKASLDCATALLSPTPDEGFSRLVQLSSGIFKNRIIHASLALTSELLIEAEEKGAGSTMQWLPSYRNMLVAAVKEARQQLGQRMQFGETNVKLYMKLSIALSQAESTETGTSLQQHMAQSAKDSLQVSYSIIQARSGPPFARPHFDGNMFTPEEDSSLNFSNEFHFNDILGTADIGMDEAFDSGLQFY